MDFLPKLKFKLRLFSFYQIIGGLIGSGLLIWLVSTITSFDATYVIVLAPAVILFLFSICCGLILLKDVKKGIQLSLINQYFQLFSFSYMGYAYLYSSGIYFTIGLNLTTDFTFLLNLGISSWTLNINTGGTAVIFNFNIVALLLIIFLTNARKQVRLEEVDRLIEHSPQDQST